MCGKKHLVGLQSRSYGLYVESVSFSILLLYCGPKRVSLLLHLVSLPSPTERPSVLPLSPSLSFSLFSRDICCCGLDAAPAAARSAPSLPALQHFDIKSASVSFLSRNAIGLSVGLSALVAGPSPDLLIRFCATRNLVISALIHHDKGTQAGASQEEEEERDGGSEVG